MNWGETPPISAAPTEPMIGEPVYREMYEAEEHNTYKVAFDASWRELQTGHNALVVLHRGYRDKEKAVFPLLRLQPSSGVAAEAANLNATASFKGDKLNSSASKIDSKHVGPELRAQLLAARDKINASERAISSKKDLVQNASLSVAQATNKLEENINSIEILKAEQAIANLQLDKEQVRRDLENYKADIKATVESAKLVTSIINCWSDPTKLFGNVVGAFNQGAVAGGAIAEAAHVKDANSKLSALDGKIRNLTNRKATLQATNADLMVDSAAQELLKQTNVFKIAVREMQTAKDEYDRSYREMSALMARVGAASGMKHGDQQALAAAVEVLPKIETIAEQLDGMDIGLTVPTYVEASGIGAAMAVNAGAFERALGLVKGNKGYIAELKAVWDGRKAAVHAAINQSMSVAGAE